MLNLCNYTAICISMIVIGAFVLVAGLYGTVIGIRDAFNNGTVGSPFSCKIPFRALPSPNQLTPTPDLAFTDERVLVSSGADNSNST